MNDLHWKESACEEEKLRHEVTGGPEREATVKAINDRIFSAKNDYILRRDGKEWAKFPCFHLGEHALDRKIPDARLICEVLGESFEVWEQLPDRCIRIMYVPGRSR